ncbi:MAG: LysM peptidoglycan-binding domain-containing protein [Nonomuraea sp.]|nr:LysM peptidoglycan-binding domain-containing protein [Nonomuraea sp.]
MLSRRRAVRRRERSAPQLTRRGRVVVVAFFVLVTLAVCFAGARAVSWAADGVPAQNHAGQPWVVVNQGDTLWKIAEAAPGDRDPATTIAEIVRINGLDDSLIRPGTRLYLPAS